jgi:hypothetical protein
VIVLPVLSEAAQEDSRFLQALSLARARKVTCLPVFSRVAWETWLAPHVLHIIAGDGRLSGVRVSGLGFGLVSH